MLDKLTYAGQPREPRRRRARARASRSCRPTSPTATRCATSSASTRPSAVVNFAAETPRRPLDRRPGAFVRTNVGRHLRAARGGAPPSGRATRRRERSASSTSRPTRSTARSAPTGAFRETTPYAPNSPYSASKAGADHLVRAYHDTYGLPALHHELLEQLRPVPVPREADPADDPERARGRSRCRSTATAATCATGSTSRTTARASCSCCERARPARSTTSAAATSARTSRSSTRSARCSSELPAAGTPRSRARARRATRSSSPSWPTAPATTAATRSTPRKIRAELGWQPRHDFEAGLRRDGALVPREPRLVRGRAVGQVPARAARAARADPRPQWKAWRGTSSRKGVGSCPPLSCVEDL